MSIANKLVGLVHDTYYSSSTRKKNIYLLSLIQLDAYVQFSTENKTFPFLFLSATRLAKRTSPDASIYRSIPLQSYLI